METAFRFTFADLQSLTQSRAKVITKNHNIGLKNLAFSLLVFNLHLLLFDLFF